MTNPELPTYRCSFDEEKKLVVEYTLNWGSSDRSRNLDFGCFESLVAIKNSERVVTADNDSFRSVLMGGRSGTGWNSDSMLPPNIIKVSQTSDAMLLEGVSSIELEHVGTMSDGRPCTFITYKRRLDELKDPSLAILLVSRPTSIIGASDIERRRSLSELVASFQRLDAIDKAVCRGYTRGDSSKDIGAKVGLTTRSVEIRRQRILEHFGFERPIEIVKMVIRLEEHGLL